MGRRLVFIVMLDFVAWATMVFIPGGTVASFYLDKWEVTNEQFQRFTREHPEYTSKLASGGPEHPVVFVTWFQAQAYCVWQAKRLPAEAEWEHAARGGNPAGEYPWGSGAPNPERANYGESKLGGAIRAGSYPPNGFGLHDMAGNVWEFTADNWRDRPETPALQGAGARKVIRGGSFGAAPEQLRVSYRDSHKPDDPVAHVGFRCARDQ